MFKDDRDFYYREKRSGLLSYLIVSLVGAIIGGLLVAYLLPGITQAPESKGEKTPPGQVSPPIVGRSGESPVIEIADKVGPAVVGITNKVNVDTFFAHQRVEQGSGSGVIFDARGYIVTNYHVVQNTDQIIVTLPDGKQVPGRVVGVDDRTDLAVIKVDAQNLTVARFGNSDNIRVGELAVAIGNPLGIEFARTVTAGVISAVNRTVNVDAQQFRLIQTDAAISPGNSGGALVNSRGEVIGINSIKIVAEEVEGLNFAIPINTVKPIVESIITRGKVVRPWLGVIVRGDVDKAMAAQFGLPVDYGVVVAATDPGAPAAKAGIAANDIIIALDNQPVRDYPGLREALEKKKIGDKVEVTVLRDKQKKNFTMTLAEMPATQE